MWTEDYDGLLCKVLPAIVVSHASASVSAAEESWSRYVVWRIGTERVGCGFCGRPMWTDLLDTIKGRHLLDNGGISTTPP